MIEDFGQRARGLRVGFDDVYDFFFGSCVRKVVISQNCLVGRRPRATQIEVLDGKRMRWIAGNGRRRVLLMGTNIDFVRCTIRYVTKVKTVEPEIKGEMEN